MSTAWVICQKELKSYFASPVAYGLMAFFAVISGYFFYIATAYFVQQGLQSQMSGRSMPMDVGEYIVRPLLMNVSVIGLFMIPMLTMRIFAEEKRTGTIELLVTSPITDIQIVAGKFLAAFIMYACILSMALLDLSLLFIYGKPDWKPMLIGFAGLLLQGACLLAIGTFISTTTRNQIIAGAGTFAVCLLLWVFDWMTAFDTSTTGKVIAYLSVVQHYEPFSKGVLDTKHIIFYLSFIFFGLFLTTRSLESLRWRS